MKYDKSAKNQFLEEKIHFLERFPGVFGQIRGVRNSRYREITVIRNLAKPISRVDNQIPKILGFSC